jgi:23S rRNA (adenine-N6)-dimethyltransferase
VAVRKRPAQRRARGAPGQHFLRSSRLAAELVREAGVEAGDLVVDVGAGAGALTRALAGAGARVVALELDPKLVEQLRRRFAARAGVEVLEADVHEWRWPETPFAVVANLPFAGSGPVLNRLLGDPRIPLRRADAIVQWEVAVKLASVWPATLKSTYWSAWYELAVTARLARSAFSPPPAVEAGVLRAVRRPRPLVPDAEHARYWRFLADGFRRRQPLRVALREHVSPRELKRLAPVLGFASDALPRDVGAKQWAALFELARDRGRV